MMIVMMIVMMIMMIGPSCSVASEHSSCLNKYWHSTALMLWSNQEPQNASLLPNVGNGYLGTVVMSESIYVAGLFQGRAATGSQTSTSHRARLQSFADAEPVRVQLMRSGGALVGTPATATPCGSVLAMREGSFRRLRYANLSIPVSAGGGYTVVTIEQMFWASRVRKRMLSMWFTVSTDRVVAGYQARVFLQRRGNSPSADISFGSVKMHRVGANNSVECDCQDGKVKVTESDGTAAGQTTVSMCYQRPPAMLDVDLDGIKHEYDYVTMISTSLDSDDPGATVLKEFGEYADKGRNMEFKAHRSAWMELTKAGVVIEGNDYLESSIYSSFYYLLSSIREDSPFSMSPGGLATNAYNGHTFWDAETWMFPPMLVFWPEIAKTVIKYRSDRLDKAKDNARLHAFKGAMFPWESASTGVEVIPDPNRNTEGKYEQHIGSDIVFAIKQYFFMTKDNAWLSETGYPLCEAIAQFWMSRVSKDPSHGNKYVINNVQPPDESAGIVNNSAFTNVGAKLALEFTAFAAKSLGFKNFAAQEQWLNVAANMYVPFDTQRQFHLEYDGFRLNGARINQADVALLQFPLEQSTSAKVDFNDLLLYEQVTDPNGYFTGDSSYSIGWLRLGHYDRAVAQFNKSFVHLSKPFNVFKERAYHGGHTNFLTGAGGYLQNVVFGFGGVRISSDGMHLYPTMIPNTTRITLRRLSYAGSLFNFGFDKSSATFNPVKTVGALVVTDQRTHTTHVLDRLLTLPLSNFIVSVASPTATPSGHKDHVVVLVAIIVGVLIVMAGVTRVLWVRFNSISPRNRSRNHADEQDDMHNYVSMDSGDSEFYL